MEKLFRFLKEQNELFNPNDVLSQMIETCKQRTQMFDDELDIDELDMVAAAQKIPDFVPRKLDQKDE